MFASEKTMYCHGDGVLHCNFFVREWIFFINRTVYIVYSLRNMIWNDNFVQFNARKKRKESDWLSDHGNHQDLFSFILDLYRNKFLIKLNLFIFTIYICVVTTLCFHAFQYQMLIFPSLYTVVIVSRLMMIMSRAQSKERPVAPTLSPTGPILLRPSLWTYQYLPCQLEH